MAFRPSRDDVTIFAIVFGVTLLVYSALVTGIVFTNHTVPNAFVYEYPSFRTTLEGRWLANIIVEALGGGNQTFQAALGFAIQAVNGLLFAEMFKVENRGQRLIIALLVALHPTFLDYYIFTSDNAALTLGCTFVLSGVLILDRVASSYVSVPVAAIAFMLALAVYPPNIAITAVVVASWLIHRAIAEPSGFLRNALLPAAIASGAGLVFYLLSAKLTISAGVDERTQLNTIAAMIKAAGRSCEIVYDRSMQQISNLPMVAFAGAGLVIVCGIASVLFQAAKRGLGALVLVAVLLALLPIGIRLAFVVNETTWPDAGRLATPYAFAFAFLAAMALRTVAVVGFAATTAALYGFIFIAVQENSFMQMKSLYEVATINRIVARIENLLPDETIRPLVVVGALPMTEPSRVLEYPKRPFRPQVWHPAFIFYRQPEVANYFLGRPILNYPTKAEVDAAVADSESKPSWPSPQSVYRLGETIVVKLGDPGPTREHITSHRPG